MLSEDSRTTERMPYRVSWRDEALVDLRDLSAQQYMAIRKMVGSFRHDRWLKGRPFRSLRFTDTTLLMLEAGERSIVYRIDEEQHLIEVFSIV